MPENDRDMIQVSLYIDRDLRDWIVQHGRDNERTFMAEGRYLLNLARRHVENQRPLPAAFMRPPDGEAVNQ